MNKAILLQDYFDGNIRANWSKMTNSEKLFRDIEIIEDRNGKKLF